MGVNIPRWKRLSTNITFQTPYFQVREDAVISPSGTHGKYFVISIPSSVMIVALTEKQEVFLVGQYRYTTDMYSWEVPGGSTDNQPILLAAQRELQEETGLISTQWQSLGIVQGLNGSSNSMINIFLAQNPIQTSRNNQQDEGINTVEKVSFNHALGMIRSGEITDGVTIAALTLAALHLGKCGCLLFHPPTESINCF